MNIVGLTFMMAGLLAFVYGFVAAEFARNKEDEFFRQTLSHCGLLVLVVGAVIAWFAYN